MRTRTRLPRAAALVALFVFSVVAPAGAQTRGSFALPLTDAREAVTRRIGSGLLLRVRKEQSATQPNFGWDVEVVRLPERPSSKNLLYHNDGGHGPDASMIYAWQVSQDFYPNRREIAVAGYPVVVTIELTDPKVTGEESDSAFVSGTLTVSWARKR